MARWRELGRRIVALDDIGKLLSAMRSLAFIEMRRLADGAARRAATVAAIQQAIDDLIAWYPSARPNRIPDRDVIVLVGSERGLCGDFDEVVASHEGFTRDSGDSLPIAVGSRLCQLLEERGMAHRAIAGAAVIEDASNVLLNMTAALGNSVHGDNDSTVGLVVIHHGDDGTVRAERVLPIPTAPSTSSMVRDRPLLQLPPRRLYEMLVEHYVFTALNVILLASLLAENRRRQEQMSGALDRLHERVDDLDRHRRQARQEAITEEIEIILLGTGA
jgi:F-type H+-transporting ATPase subunit gamma